MPTVQIENISKFYGKVRVLHGITQHFSSGIHLIRGKNGSGKSTLLKIIAGIAIPHQGLVSTTGFSPQPSIAFFANDTGLYPKLSVSENLLFFQKLLYKNKADISSILECWKLTETRNKQIQELSAGLRARVGIARTFLNSPDILIFDEPTAFLDQETIFLFQEAIKMLRPSQIALIATHDFERLDAIDAEIFELQKGALWKV